VKHFSKCTLNCHSDVRTETMFHSKLTKLHTYAILLAYLHNDSKSYNCMLFTSDKKKLSREMFTNADVILSCFG
jgi:hypothetical protein